MIAIYFGSPGCGKTTVATKILRKYMKKKRKRVYEKAYTSFQTQRIPNTVYVPFLNNVLGDYTPPEYSLVVDDEVGITYNSRKFKTMSQQTIEWFKLHRHYKVDYLGFSQAFDDMDITLRRLATEYWYVQRLGPWSICRRVYKFCMVDEHTHQIVDGYRMASVASAFTSLLAFLLRPVPVLRDLFRQQWTLTFRPFYYRYFDSYSHPDLPLLE